MQCSIKAVQQTGICTKLKNYTATVYDSVLGRLIITVHPTSGRLYVWLILPPPPTSRRWGPPDPTSLLLWCRTCLLGPQEPKTLESHRMCWSDLRNPFLQRQQAEWCMYEWKHKPNSSAANLSFDTNTHLLYKVQSQRFSRNHQYPAANCPALDLCQTGMVPI